MVRKRRGLARATAAFLVLPLALGGCGRKGPLDLPPDSTVPQAAPPAAPHAFLDPTDPTGAAQPALPPQAQAAPAAPPQRKSFLLDPLIR